jgi:hypothetical protein
MTVSDGPSPIFSYQRIFRPDRRIYQVDGRRLPIPGGVPLEWLAWALAALTAVLVLSERSLTLAVTLAGVGGLLGSARGWPGALVGTAAGFLGSLGVGVLVGWLAWPLRLLVLPGIVGTLARQASPDGRPAHRYLRSWVALHLRARRRSLNRAVVVDGEPGVWAPRVWVAPDHHSPVLQRGRVCGPARLVFGRPVVVIARRGRHIARPAEGHRIRASEQVAEVIELDTEQVLEIRP